LLLLLLMMMMLLLLPSLCWMISFHDHVFQMTSARSSLEQDLNLVQAEARSLSGQLREARTKLGLLQEDHAALEGVMAKLKEERQQLITVCTCMSVLQLFGLHCRICNCGRFNCVHILAGQVQPLQTTLWPWLAAGRVCIQV
jgi:hypothetical protein